MTNSTEQLASLIEETILADRNTLTRTVSYAIEHSMSALHTANMNAHSSATTHLRLVFDWFVALVCAFRSVPSGVFRLLGDGVWISKHVVISLSVMADVRPDLVAEFRDHHTDGVKYTCSPNTTRLFREIHFEGELLRQVMTSNHTFGDLGPFTSRKTFMEYAFIHARRVGTHLGSMELMCASTFRSWTMDIDLDVPPWRRRWKVYEKLNPQTVTFRGQRAVASTFLDIEGAEPSFRGRWVLGAGGDASARSQLVNDTFGRGWSSWTPWTSFLVPWISPSFVESALASGGNGSSDSPKKKRVRAFLQLAAVLDASPEAYDLSMEAWHCTATNKQLSERLCRVFPHMTHVVDKLARYTERFCPPDVLCDTIVNAAESHVKADGRETFHDPEKMCALRENPPPDVSNVVRTLRDEGCFETADAVEAYATPARGPCEVFAYGPEADVTWIDLWYSKEHVWPDVFGAHDVPVVARGARRHFIIVARERGAPPTRAHPLSALMTSGWKTHPMWCPRPDLLVACV